MFGSSNTWGQQNQQQQQPQQQQGGLFGGGTTGGFGQPQNTGFGAATSTFGQPAQQQQPASGGLFGGGGGSTSSFGGFGGNTAATSTFGARPQAPGFGATGSSMFGGGGGSTSTFGAAPATSTFGGGGNVFGAKPATTFGAPAASSPGGLFGAPKTTGFGAAAPKYNPDTPKQLLEPPLPTQGTAAPAYEPTWIQEGDKNTKQTNHLYHSICLMEPYQGASPEELRLQDYQQNRKTASAPPATGFGQTSTFGGGGFGQQAQAGPSGTTAPATGFGGGFGSTSTGFGAQPAASTSGLFGQQQPAQSGGLFGQQQPTQPAQTGGLFGSQPASTGFGAAASTTPASTFGGFGASKPAAASPFGGFGAQAQPAQPASTGFGAQPAQPASAPSFGGFGSTTTPAAPAGGLFGGGASTGFGAQQPAATGGLFGQQNQQQQQQQQQPAATGGLFGSAPKPAGGLFGGGASTTAPSFGGFGNTSTTTPSTGGLFGSTNNNTSNTTGGGLFGQQQQPQQQQQAQPATGGLFGGNSGGTGGLFGAKPAAAPTGGLFGAAPAAPAAAPSFGGFGASQTGGGSLFGAKPATGGSGLFGGLGQSQQQQPQQQSSLFGSTQQQPPQQQQQQQQQLTASVDQNAYGNNPLFQFQAPPLDFTEKKKAPLPPLSSSFRHGTPNSAKRVTRLRGFASPSTSTTSPRPLNNSTGRPLLSGLSDEPLSPNAFAPRASVKRLDLGTKSNGGEFLSSVLGKSLAAPPTPRSPAVDSPRPAAAARSTPQRAAPRQDAAVRKGDYWCKPDLDTISRMSHMELTAVEGFVAGRLDYGQVAFLEPVDLTSLPSINDMLGRIIVFEQQTCEVYPDESDKPPVGQGLNVPAKITLNNCYPRDKATGDMIKDPKHAKMEVHIRRLQKIPDTEYIDFDRETGIWSFKVQHFSKYGLVDSDDEEDEEQPMEEEAPPVRTIEDESFDEEESMEDEKTEVDEEETDDIYSQEEEESDDDLPRSLTPPEPRVFDEPKLASRPWTTSLGPDGARKVRVMQASLFKSSPQPQQPKQVKQMKRDFDHAEEETVADTRDVKRPSLGEEVPMVVRQKVEYVKVPLADSVSRGAEGAQRDAGLALGRSFRAGWGPNGELVHLGRIAGPKATVTAPRSSQVMLQTVDVFALDKANEIARSLNLLTRQLDHTSIEVEDGIPVASTSTDLRFSHFTAAFAKDDRAHEANVWTLGHALFDEIPEGALRRKLALTSWLETAVASAVEHDLLTADDAASKIFTLLSGNQIERATQAAIDAGDMRLATLVAQAGGPQMFKDDILLQLTKWNEYKADAHISVAYRRVYALLAGIVDVSLGVKSRDQVDASPDVVVAAGLDWKRAFGLHLWHGTSFDASIPDALGRYEQSLGSANPPARPLPPYVEKAQKWRVRDATDILYGLMRVFSDPSLELDAILHASEASASPIDHRIPWHIYTVISRVLRLRDFADREGDMADEEEGYSATADRVTASYAAQLEALGLWQWSIYVSLHLQMPESREKAVRDILFRHPDPTHEEREFVTGQMRVPEAWLAESKAASLAAEGDAYGEYKALLQAGLYDRAHRIVVDKLASEAVVRNDLQLLRKLFSPLEHRRIGNWDYGGRLFLEYADILTLVPGLVAAVQGATPDGAQLARLQELAQALPRILQLLPLAFPNKQDVQQIACLSEMLSALHKLAGPLHLAGLIARPPVPPLLVDADRLQLLQSAAFDAFSSQLVSLRA